MSGHAPTNTEWSGEWAVETTNGLRVDKGLHTTFLESYATGGVYLNATSPDEGEGGVSDALGAETYERLATIKAQWDLENVFHLNPNVRPAT